MSFEAYKVAVKLSLINNVGAGLVTLAGQFQSLNRHIGASQASITALERQMLNLKKIGLIGGAAAAAGGVGLSMFAAPLEEAKKFQIEAAKFASLGFGEKINSQAVQFASGMKTIGTSARENMGIVGDAMAVFKDLHESQMVAPLMAKMKFANKVIFGADGGERDTKLMDMMKVVEFRGGLSSPEEFARQANFAQQAIAGSRNRVDSSAMLQALKTGGVALSRRSNEAFYLGAEPLLQEFGGFRYGTAAMSIYQNLVQARGTITAQQELNRLGLLDKSKIEFNSLGKLKKALPGAFTGSGVLEKEGELALLEKVLLPAFSKAGITSDEGILQELGMILGNRTGSSLMARIYQQREKLHMQTDANYHAENLDQASDRASKTLAGKEVDLWAKWHDVLKELGETILPVAIRGVEGLTSVLVGVRDFAREFPMLTKGLTLAFGVLAGVVAVGGTLALATAGFKGLGLALALGSSAGGIGGALASVAKGIGLISKASGVFLAAYAGWKAGGWINDNIVNPTVQKLTGDKNQTLGGWVYDFTHQSWGMGSSSAMGKGSPYVASKSQQPINVTVTSVLDGREVGRSTAKIFSKEASRPFSGITGFDYSQAPPPVAMGYQR